MTREQAFQEFLACGAVRNQRDKLRSEPDDLEDAFYAGWEAGWLDADEYYRAGGSFK